jgi:thymidylate synthase
MSIGYFKTAQKAFEHLYYMINDLEVSSNGTKKLKNVGFYIEDPKDNCIDTPYRKWNKTYAKRELDWYLSKNRSVEELKKFAPIWDKMHNGDNIVNSNYGFLWNQNGQLKKVIQQLKDSSNTRQAWISIFDGKKKKDYQYDTPCTLNLGFTIDNGKLCMTVLMRSNDLWYGFCNDQFCFSYLQGYIAKELKLEVGWYYHFAADLHLYEAHFNKNK